MGKFWVKNIEGCNGYTFVGSTFKSRLGGELQVQEVLKDISTTKYIITCSICSQDEELFPYKSLITRKANLLKNESPCGCGVSYRWSEEQTLLRVKRDCTSRGSVTLLGFVEPWAGNKTKLKLRCDYDGNIWDTTTVSNFFCSRNTIHKNTNCCQVCTQKLAIKTNTKSDSSLIAAFISSGSFLEGTVFTRCENVNGRYRWEVKCPICSVDEYTTHGVCSGLFSSTSARLRVGGKSCRCSKNYRWTREQREYQILKLCTSEGLCFKGWMGEYKNKNTKFKWICKGDHEGVNSTIDSFLSGRRCRLCANEDPDIAAQVNGFMPHRVDEEDYLYFFNFKNKYLKVGRSINVPSRKKFFSTVSGVRNEDIDLLALFTSNHKEVYYFEQKLLKVARSKDFQYKVPFSNECFSMDAYDLIMETLKDSTINPLNSVSIV